jgi:hypothetical protein
VTTALLLVGGYLAIAALAAHWQVSQEPSRRTYVVTATVVALPFLMLAVLALIES